MAWHKTSNVVLVDKWLWICWDSEFGEYYLDKYFMSKEEAEASIKDIVEPAQWTKITVQETETCD